MTLASKGPPQCRDTGVYTYVHMFNYKGAVPRALDGQCGYEKGSVKFSLAGIYCHSLLLMQIDGSQGRGLGLLFFFKGLPWFFCLLFV